MADDFEQDLAQLRSEIARFVLEAIAADPNGEVARSVGAGLREAVSTAIAEQNLSGALRRSVADGFERALPTLTDAAARAAAAAPETTPANPFTELRRAEPARDGWSWLKGPQGLGLIVGSLALIVAVVTLGLIFTQPRNDARPQGGGEVAQTQGDGGQALPDAEAGWQRVLDQVQTWPQAERRPALDALCGQGVQRANCPTFDARRYVVSDARQRTAAAVAIARAMGELGYCAPPATPEASATNSATNSAAAASSAASDTVWDCLVYGAARG